MAKRIKVDIPRVDAINYIREGLKREGLIAPDDDADFVINGDAVNDDDVLVEVANVSVGVKPREKGVSLADLRSAAPEEEVRQPAKKTRKPYNPDEPRTLVHDEDEEAIEKEIKSFNKRMPAKPAVGKDAAQDDRSRRSRVGDTLEDLGKDPTDMSDEIG